MRRVDILFRFLKVGESTTLHGLRKMTGLEVYLSCLRLEDGELLIIASTKHPELAIERYVKRWEIETLFSCLKGRGFNLEDTHITKLIVMENERVLNGLANIVYELVVKASQQMSETAKM
jgi:hypothetical protein